MEQTKNIDTAMATITNAAEKLLIPVGPTSMMLQLLVFLTFLIGSIGGFIGVGSLVGGESTCNMLALFGGLGVGAGLMILVEKVLKRGVRPNRFVHATSTAIELLAKRKSNFTIDPTLQVNVLFWHFRIKKRARVPKGWYVVAVALEQDELYLAAYTLVSPENFAELNTAKQFMGLCSRKELAKMQDEGGLRQAGVQRRLHTAEYARMMDGAEMLPADFKTYLQFLQTNFPKWMPDFPIGNLASK